MMEALDLQIVKQIRWIGANNDLNDATKLNQEPSYWYIYCNQFPSNPCPVNDGLDQTAHVFKNSLLSI
jgi:hypothetical protein